MHWIESVESITCVASMAETQESAIFLLLLCFVVQCPCVFYILLTHKNVLRFFLFASISFSTVHCVCRFKQVRLERVRFSASGASTCSIEHKMHE